MIMRRLCSIFLVVGLLFGTASGVPLVPVAADHVPNTGHWPTPRTKMVALAQHDLPTVWWGQLVAIDGGFDDHGHQVHMGYWSGGEMVQNPHGPGQVWSSNRDHLLRVLNAIHQPNGANKAFWDEGIGTAHALPAYQTMTDEEWYERAKLQAGEHNRFTDNHIQINGHALVDPHPVTKAESDDIWGRYSQRYAEMAIEAFRTTGNRVQVWCFVDHATWFRVFYKYELPFLVVLENLGIVDIHVARTSAAIHTNVGDWFHGAANVPDPV